jgi:hypothetical protein
VHDREYEGGGPERGEHRATAIPEIREGEREGARDEQKPRRSSGLGEKLEPADAVSRECNEGHLPGRGRHSALPGAKERGPGPVGKE